MSIDIEESTSDRTEFVNRASGLLKDFSVKLSDFASKLMASQGKARDEAVQWFKCVRPHAEELARQVSAEIEAGRASGIEKADLALRLADFEYHLNLCVTRSGEPVKPRVFAKIV